MPSIEVTSPVSSAPTDRLALGVGWVRQGVAGIAGTLNPSGHPVTANTSLTALRVMRSSTLPYH